VQGYWVTPMRSYYSDGCCCREYESRSLFNGQVQVATSHACRRSDGIWVVVN
jgi:surface antigen